MAPLAPGVDPPPPPAWLTQVSVETAEGAAERVERAGGRVVAGPLEFDIGRLVVADDPGGAVFNAWEPRTRHGAQLVDEPGAWSMSRLATPIPSAPPPSTATCSAGRPRRSGPRRCSSAVLADPAGVTFAISQVHVPAG